MCAGSIKDKITIEYGPIFSIFAYKCRCSSGFSFDNVITVPTKMGQGYTLLTFDQAIYDIVKGKVFKNYTTLNFLIIFPFFYVLIFLFAINIKL